MFNVDYVSPRIQRQIKEYTNGAYKYTYSGILRTLKYFYEIKHNTIDPTMDTIGIVPWIYQEAYRYYYAIWAAKQINEGRTQVQQARVEVTIPSPERKPAKKKKFKFLDEENVDE